jgi:hypothetical protein
VIKPLPSEDGSVTATAFEIVHRDEVLGKLTFYDRMIFKGHLVGLIRPLGMKAFLDSQGVLLKDYGGYVKAVTDALKAHVQAVAAAAGAPYRYLHQTHTKAAGRSKEDLARQIATERGMATGLVCVLAAVEPCSSFDVGADVVAGRLAVRRRPRKCLHFYFYLLHPTLGLVHVRLQSWFPFTVQIWVNGRQMLARALDKAGIGYRRYANTFLHIDDWGRAQTIAEKLGQRRWPRLLTSMVAPLCPILATIARAGFGRYYWVADQMEVATDVAFTSQPALDRIMPDLIAHATHQFSCDDVLMFPGRKPHPALAVEIGPDTRRREQGWRVKHRLDRNSIKMYDKASVLRVETTINNPAQFRVLRITNAQARWCPMRKGVANLPRYLQVGEAANHRYLTALGDAQPTHGGKHALARLCQPRVTKARRHARFNPLSRGDVALFRAVLAGEHTITGFRNRDITARLYPNPPTSHAEAKRRCQRTSRLIDKLRGHRLIAKVPHRRLYRTTSHGHLVMTAALAIHDHDFPLAYTTAQGP